MATLSVARAWFVAHRGRSALVAVILVGGLFALFGATSISVWGSVRQIPLWAFVPGTLVMIAGTTWDGRLDAWPAVDVRRVRVARALWVALVVIVVALAAVPTAVAVDNAGIVTTAVVLVVVAFAPGLVDIRLTTAVGGAFDMGAFLLAGRLRETDNARALFLESMPGWVWAVLLGVGSVGIASYIWRGARRIGAAAPG